MFLLSLDDQVLIKDSQNESSSNLSGRVTFFPGQACVIAVMTGQDVLQVLSSVETPHILEYQNVPYLLKFL